MSLDHVFSQLNIILQSGSLHSNFVILKTSNTVPCSLFCGQMHAGLWAPHNLSVRDSGWATCPWASPVQGLCPHLCVQLLITASGKRIHPPVLWLVGGTCSSTAGPGPFPNNSESPNSTIMLKRSKMKHRDFKYFSKTCKVVKLGFAHT